MMKVQDVLPGMIYISPIDGSSFGEWLEVRKVWKRTDSTGSKVTLYFDNGLTLTWSADTMLDIFDPDTWIPE